MGNAGFISSTVLLQLFTYCKLNPSPPEKHRTAGANSAAPGSALPEGKTARNLGKSRGYDFGPVTLSVALACSYVGLALRRKLPSKVGALYPYTVNPYMVYEP